jgi:RNA polymerase sigma-70 factor (ECF subfamily)
MRISEPDQEFEAAVPRIFETTQWSVVLAAGAGGSETSRRALEELCDAYWYPIYFYVRRRGYGPDDAQDLTQEFFAQLIAKEHLRLADQSKGKFRSFLLATLQFFLARAWSRAHRQKRGGHFQFVSLDEQMPEERYQLEPTDCDTPEKNFQRQWAVSMLKQTMKALAMECAEAGKAKLFDELKPLLSGDREGATYAAISARLSMTEGAVRVAVHRMRQRYGELLRTEIAQTVDSNGDVEQEVRDLLHALSE